jgi:S-adenosyl methyltransferase
MNADDLSGSREPMEIDTEKAHAARVYNWLLGGTDNFAIDREVAVRANEGLPGGLDGARANVRANRDFLGRAVRHLVGEAGIRQFLDIGTGVPDADNVHAVAQAAAPECRVVCVDSDPVVLAHAHCLMASTPEGRSAFVYGDLRDPDEILAAAAETLDFKKPVAVMLVAILHFFTDADDPFGIVGRLMNAVCPGSFLVVSHGAADIDAENMAELTRRLSEGSHETFVWRSHSDVFRFFDGLELIEPGVVPVDEWRPDNGTDRGVDWTIPFYGGLGRKHP